MAGSAPGAALCYETICVEASRAMGGYHNPEITLHMLDFAEHVCCIEREDWDGVAQLLLASARKLAGGGASFVICPDNTAHIAMDRVVPRSPLPWLHIAEAVVQEAASHGYRRLGLLGTRYLVESAVYPDSLRAAGIDWRLPDPPDRERINEIIFQDLVLARVTPEAQADLFRIVENLASRHGCDAVVLGCTEIPLAISAATSPLPVLDSTRLLARAALARALHGHGD